MTILVNRLARTPGVWLLVACLATTLVYWSGLRGPFLMDDGPQLAPIAMWLEGRADLRDVLFGNSGWWSHRSAAFATLAFNAWLGGYSPYTFKLGNLLFHLICGLAAYLTLQAFLRHDPTFREKSAWAALAVSAVWLLHPLNVSTVLYPVQRMAQVATLASLLTLWAYAAIRARMLAGTVSSRVGSLGLWACVGLGTLLGMQGKQSAVVIPALCLVVELAWFQRPADWRPAIRWFYIVTVAVPAVLVLAAPVLFHDRLLASFTDYEFGPTERVLTQGRVLADYIRQILLPYTPSMGLFFDDFSPSRSFVEPVSTALSWLALAAVSAVAIKVRRASPSFFAGWFIFLTAHSVEASYVPIELYYEHRNYFPALGLLLAAGAVVARLTTLGQQLGLRTGRIVLVATLGIALALVIQTLGRSLVWQHGLPLTAAGVQSHPRSFRANFAFANASIHAGKPEQAFATYAEMVRDPDPGLQAYGLLGRLHAQCVVYRDGDPTLLARAVTLLPEKLSLEVFFLLAATANSVITQGCGKLTPAQLAQTMEVLADRSLVQPEASELKLSARYYISRLYLRQGDYAKAVEQARRSWQPGASPEVGRNFVEALIANGELDEAQQVLASLASMQRINLTAGKAEPRDILGLHRLQEILESRRLAKSAP